MTVRPDHIKPPSQAGPARRAFHTLIAIVGWALFVYWWWIVFHRVSRHEIRFTLLFIVLSLTVIVVVTAVWVLHNLGIYRRRGPRTRVREVDPDFSRDGIGRDVTFIGVGEAHRSAPVVYVRFVGRSKIYEPAERLDLPRAVGNGT